MRAAPLGEGWDEYPHLNLHKKGPAEILPGLF